MKFPLVSWRACRTAMTLPLLALLLELPAVAGPYRITVDTTPLQGVVGYMAFDFLAGSPATGNAAVLSAFGSNASLGLASATGNTSGSLSPGPLALGGGDQLFSEWLQAVSAFGSTLTFDINLGTAVAPAGGPISSPSFCSTSPSCLSRLPTPLALAPCSTSTCSATTPAR